MHILDAALEQPVLHSLPDGQQGFRFADPQLPHFCLLKGSRAVSALNACVALVRGGFTQEMAVLLRGLIECTTQIDYALSGILSEGAQRPAPKRYVEAYFLDSRRGPGELTKKPKIRQEDVHREIASDSDKLIAAMGDDDLEFDMLGRLSRIYATFSNYVHARYPEVMDLYGGRPGRFHLKGMRDSPKDRENLDVLNVYVVTASNCFALMVHSLGMKQLVLADPLTARWFNARHQQG